MEEIILRVTVLGAFIFNVDRQTFCLKANFEELLLRIKYKGMFIFNCVINKQCW